MARELDEQDEPINILARIVIGSVNDVLAGYQTYEEHEKNLRDMAAEYAAQGIKLPLELERITNDETDYRYSHEPAYRGQFRQDSDTELPDPDESLRDRSFFD